jgi:hypothetical protein
VATLGPMLLHLIAQPVAFVFCPVVAFICVRYFQTHVPTIILTLLLSQNLFVSLLSPNFVDINQLDPLKGYSILTIFSIWALMSGSFLRCASRHSPFVRQLFVAATAMIGIISIYFFFGLGVNSRNAIFYMRNLSMPLVLFQVFLVIACRRRLDIFPVVSFLFFFYCCVARSRLSCRRSGLM